MPELPEVEVVKKSLQKNIYHLILKKIEIRDKFLRYKINEKMIDKMIKSKVLSVTRRSKYIFINLDNNYTILIHLGMTGKVIIDFKRVKHKSSFYYQLSDNNPKHDHVIIKFNNGSKLIYNDVRKFGFIKVVKTLDLSLNPHIKKLGPEPLSNKFNPDYFRKKIQKRTIIIKDLLMNQNFVSGLGNIYVNEALFLSKIHPKRKVKKLTNKNIVNLVKYIKDILRKAIKEGGSSIKDFNNVEGKEGNFQQFFYAYNRLGKPCKRIKCKGLIKRIKISNRSSFYCDICQK